MKTTQTMKFTIKDSNDEDKEVTLLFTQLMPSKSIKVVTYLTRVLGTTAGKAMGSMGSLDLKALDNLSMDKLGDAIAQLFETIDDDSLIEKMDILLQSVTHENNVVSVDYFLFHGNLPILFKVIKKALEVNFKSFLDGNSGLLEKLKATLKIIQKVAPSTGISGAPSSVNPS